MMATGVGVVEKIITFFFLFPSAFMAALSALVAQNIGAGKLERAKSMLRYSLIITIFFGTVCFVLCQLIPNQLVSLFTDEKEVILYGGEYLRTYALDCVFAAIHFCLGGYFCGSKHSEIPFIHSVISVVCIRIPGAYFATILFPQTLLPMGLVAPIGSLLSAFICICFYKRIKKQAVILT
jgi:Na+-driven multidrug efflux pump